MPIPPRPAERRPAPVAAGLHPRNRHQGRYDMARLLQANPALRGYLRRTPDGGQSIDFSAPAAVRELNRALLASDYGIAHWNIPDGYLCPPVPGRADYLHGLADLLAGDGGGTIPRGPDVRVLDIGVGANCIYPLLGQAEYGWRFVGSDIDTVALQSARANVQANGLEAQIELRRQHARGRLFDGLLQPGERFHLTLCNPPFHASAREAAQGSQRKLRNLGGGAPSSRGTSPVLNFGGQANELWCTGGEVSFLKRMVRESVAVQAQVLWFSSLVAKSEHLPDLHRQLAKAGAAEVREVAMAQGSKQSRFLAWSFHAPHARRAWLGHG
ncbi:23S rRNA (adenine(1618)-N(6))-methyltransferase RlmF [Stenotrophomonas mori]|uniref:Ribosomal RNA large subunit methyltransferase F n=1 Tax=Stenotrophomonas mori TaxID=2871096 RepID=A0ABT0SLL6_9GAMM|nr:23S rRNA (adenine(1618)-N(6))-methyltransferase RlmF [Stenotrophomonas mori]MCL7715880.1 23S rRNA (adenine(1618)-N(6))-methyltransferase RlmF [Stenotrophomonas mori]